MKEAGENKGEKKMDRRARYTNMVIRESFVELLSKKPISKITVKEICENADVNRATFYAHFQDPYDLMRRIEDEFTDNIQRYIEGESFGSSQGSALLASITSVLEYVKSNAKLCKVLFSPHGDVSFISKFMQILGKQFVADWTKEQKLDVKRAEYIVSFAMGGAVELISKWLMSGMKEKPAEMAELMLTLEMRGAAAYV